MRGIRSSIILFLTAAVGCTSLRPAEPGTTEFFNAVPGSSTSRTVMYQSSAGDTLRVNAGVAAFEDHDGLPGLVGKVAADSAVRCMDLKDLRSFWFNDRIRVYGADSLPVSARGGDWSIRRDPSGAWQWTDAASNVSIPVRDLRGVDLPEYNPTATAWLAGIGGTLLVGSVVMAIGMRNFASGLK